MRRRPCNGFGGAGHDRYRQGRFCDVTTWGVPIFLGVQNSDGHMRGEAGGLLNYHKQSRIVETEFYIMAMDHGMALG